MLQGIPTNLNLNAFHVQLYKMAYTQRAFLIIASAVQNGGLTFDEAEVNGFFEKLSYGEKRNLGYVASAFVDSFYFNFGIMILLNGERF